MEFEEETKCFSFYNKGIIHSNNFNMFSRSLDTRALQYYISRSISPLLYIVIMIVPFR
jgi:hypothetical protein